MVQFLKTESKLNFGFSLIPSNPEGGQENDYWSSTFHCL